MKEIRLAVIPGDGIGKETVAAGKKVLDAVADVHGGFLFRYKQFDWSCEYYAMHGRMMPENGLDLLRPHDPQLKRRSTGLAWQPCYRIPAWRNLGQRLCVPPFRMVCLFQALNLSRSLVESFQAIMEPTCIF